MEDKDFKEALTICMGIYDEDITLPYFQSTKHLSLQAHIKGALDKYSIEHFRELQKEFSKHDGKVNIRFTSYGLYKNLAFAEENIKKRSKETEENIKNLPAKSLIPEIFDDLKRVTPNAFLRSALFGVIKPGKRIMVKKYPINSLSQYTITLSGERLDQNDLRVWDAITFLASQKQAEDKFETSLYELCKFLGYKNDTKVRQQIYTRLERLKLAMVSINYQRNFYWGNLIDNVVGNKETGKTVIYLNKKLLSIFGSDDYSFINQEISNQLNDNQIASWLFHFYETHEAPIPYTIEKLKELCGSETNIYDFKQRVKESLSLIQKIYREKGLKFEYELRNDLLIISKDLKNFRGLAPTK